MLSVIQGGFEMAVGAGGTAVATVTGVGVVATPATVALGVHGATTTGTALSNLMNPTKVEAKSTEGGRGSNNRTPDPEATGDHSVSNRNGSTTFKRNDRNPTRWDEVSRTRNSGKPHGGIKPPYIINKGQKTRSANPSEISTDLSKNGPLSRFLYPTTNKP